MGNEEVKKEGYKNSICIEVNSTSDDPVIISKPDTITQPETVQETVNMMSLDFKTLCIAISEMAYLGHSNGYFDGNEVLDNCIKELNEFKLKLNDDTK